MITRAGPKKQLTLDELEELAETEKAMKERRREGYFR